MPRRVITKRVNVICYMNLNLLLSAKISQNPEHLLFFFANLANP